MRAVTEEYERQLWEELNSLLADAIPEDASEADALRAIRVAVMGADLEIADLYERVWTMALECAPYLRGKLSEDNPVSAIRGRLGQR
jgi:surfactin synthase thioesterase subunit